MKVTYITVKEKDDLYTYQELTKWLDDKLILGYDNSFGNHGILGVVIPERMRMKTPRDLEHKVERYYGKIK